MFAAVAVSLLWGRRARGASAAGARLFAQFYARASRKLCMCCVVQRSQLRLAVSGIREAL